MAIRDIFKVSRKTFFNPGAWIDYEGFKTHTRTIFDSLRATFAKPRPEREETFAQAMKRLDLSEADVKSAATNYRLFALLFVAIALAVFIYTFYILFRYGTLTGWLLGMVTTGLFLAQAFKYDFWAFQLHRKKLGATFAEWKQHILGGTGKSHD